jgi:hypothetical protein
MFPNTARSNHVQFVLSLKNFENFLYKLMLWYMPLIFNSLQFLNKTQSLSSTVKWAAVYEWLD